MAPNDTAYKWCHSVHKLLYKLCRTFPPAPRNGGSIYLFWASRPCGPVGWLPLLLTKAGDVETNPGPTISHKRVWICDICYKQIYVRKQISIRCNRIEYWVHLRCAGIRQAQYTDTWTCHLHRESGFAPHTDITPTPPDSGPNPIPTPHLHHLQTTLIHNTSAALDTIPEPRVPPTCPALTTPHPSPTPALPSTSHHHTPSADTHATQTTVHASQSLQPHHPHRVPRHTHRQTKDDHRHNTRTQTQQ